MQNRILQLWNWPYVILGVAYFPNPIGEYEQTLPSRGIDNGRVVGVIFEGLEKVPSSPH